MRVFGFVPLLLSRRQRHDNAREWSLVRHAIGITHVETTLATRPTKGEVGRANAGFGELFEHGEQPSAPTDLLEAVDLLLSEVGVLPNPTLNAWSNPEQVDAQCND